MTAPREFTDLLAIARGYQRSRALTVVAELGIADLLRDGPRTADDLADACAARAGPLYRLLRAVASLGVLHEDDGKRFSLTPMGEFLRSDHRLSVLPVARMFGADYEWSAWGKLEHTVRTGENGAVAALGMSVWDYRRNHPADGEVFDDAMRTFSRGDAGALLAVYDFSQHRLLADIGGGTGGSLATVLAACPATRGLLFDQPQVVAAAPPIMAEAGVADRVTIVGGNFFESVPEGADAYMLRRVIHDWMDEEAIAILRCVRGAMTSTSRLLVADAVVGAPGEDPLTKFLDLMMLVSAGGRERTEAEWKQLLAASGFRLERCTKVTANLSIIEGIPQ